MQLNLPTDEVLHHSRNILITGLGGGFDIFGGLPLYFSLRAQGKRVHLASYSFTDFRLAQMVSAPEILIPSLLMGARGPVWRAIPYYPEGYLAQWFDVETSEAVPVWMFARVGALPLTMAYNELISHLEIDAVIGVDGGVDSLMCGDEAAPGTLLEDSLSLTAFNQLNVPVKLVACLGWGTEVEEGVNHALALENMAALAREGAFIGACALTPQMEAFQLYQHACRHVWDQPSHSKSHIHTRVIPAVEGHFGDIHLYPDDARTSVMVSPLMALYWFYDARAVIRRNLLVPLLAETLTHEDARRRMGQHLETLNRHRKLRARRPLPY